MTEELLSEHMAMDELPTYITRLELMKSLMLLLQSVLHDMGTGCRTSTTMDLKTVHRRIEDEGISFLTIALPSFGSDLQKGLDQGWVDRRHFLGFRKSGELPLFLGGFLDLIFDRSSGRLLDDPSIDAIRAVRQFTLMFNKIALECSDERVRGAIDKYVECESIVKEHDALLNESQKDEFARISLLLYGETLQKLDEDIYYGRILPKHGPGATADRLKGNRKYEQTEWTSRLEKVFPHWEMLSPGWSFYNELDHVSILEPGSERPVRVITVPKTLKTPRIIAVEPTCMQYMQQGLMEKLVEYLEGDDIPSRFIGFTDQTPNQEFARIGSLSGELATLDLSEASDRVSNQHVRFLTRYMPNVAKAFDATRSRKADVPGYGVLRLAKFASMGSALCFPVEAMVFTTLIFMGIQSQLNRQMTREDIKSFSGRVRVYGDDMIVPVDFVQPVVSMLETFGFKVNASKSFWTGKFRESCGKDYYDGNDVTVVRMRQLLPSRREDAQEIISTVSLRNQLYKAGYWNSVRYLDTVVEKVIPFPAVHETSPVLGKHSFLGYETQKMCVNLHRPLVRGAIQSSVIPKSNLQGSGALLKYFLKRGAEPFQDKNHLERFGRPDTVGIKIRWASAT